MKHAILSDRLILKLALSSLALLFIAGVCYMVTAFYLSNTYYYETTQRLHADLAQNLIDEKFAETTPFNESGAVNKALFGDIMHDMMAVNRAIEVYLLDTEGTVKYSVVLDEKDHADPSTRVDLAPVKDFIAAKGQHYILGDDPRNPGEKKVFSAAHFKVDESEGYIYIVLAGKDYLLTRQTLFNSYFLKLGLGGFVLTLLFTALLGFLSIWYLTKNLRQIVYAAKRFQEGDLQYRIPNAGKTDLAGVAHTYNNMAETILQDIEKIKSLEHVRRELIANISHDLRTPLSIIQGYIETLQIKDEQLSSEERSQYLKTIRTSGASLSRLISQLFEYSKLESNQIQPQKEPFLISELINDVHQNYAVLAQQKGIALTLQMPEGIPLVFADIALVERAIQNLMDNALKFTPSGGEILLNLKGHKDQVEIIITDSGPGIAKEHQALIFERYRQTKTGKEKEGAGLGLAIVKKIIDLHNASIQVFSRPNEGTTFSFNLPVYKIT